MIKIVIDIKHPMISILTQYKELVKTEDKIEVLKACSVILISKRIPRGNSTVRKCNI
jgi:hypothetical protein